ncbi:MAG: methionine ABC transporter ATP-binding protein [Alphaproteobacteria bacterium PA3]|nr:MAG: methionine ABC transporter ATP-binding protein [Alphaproteobacteria bacterium PA3]
MSDSLSLPQQRSPATARAGTVVHSPPLTTRQPLAGPLVAIDSVSRRFGGVVALDGVSLQVAQGQVFGIIGRSGAGKSTLIRTLNALETVDSGRVVVNGQDLARLDEPALRQVRRGIGMVFQHFNLLSAKTVAQNVAMPLKLAGVPPAERDAAVQRLLALVGLSDKADVYPAQLSGGQKQRVGIARALVSGPQLLLSDEATSALDPETTLSILRLLKDLNRTLGVTIVLITHEMSVIREICDQVAVLDAGRVVEQGPVWQVFARPRADITRRLLRTVRPPLPDSLQAVLQPQPVPGGRTLLRIGSQGHEGHGEVLALLAAEPAWAPQIVHAEVDRIAGHAVGSVTFSVAERGGAALAALRHELARQGIDAEVLGHVLAS